MVNFLIGIIVAAVLAFGVYYVWVLRAAEDMQKEPQDAGLQIQVGAKKVPEGAVMEDGTLSE